MAAVRKFYTALFATIAGMQISPPDAYLGNWMCNSIEMNMTIHSAYILLQLGIKENQQKWDDGDSLS